jgi:hypothetical protein
MNRTKENGGIPMPQAMKYAPGMTVFKVVSNGDGSWDARQKQIYRGINAPNPICSRESRRRRAQQWVWAALIVLTGGALAAMFVAGAIHWCGR